MIVADFGGGPACAATTPVQQLVITGRAWADRARPEDRRLALRPRARALPRAASASPSSTTSTPRRTATRGAWSSNPRASAARRTCSTASRPRSAAVRSARSRSRPTARAIKCQRPASRPAGSTSASRRELLGVNGLWTSGPSSEEFDVAAVAGEVDQRERGPLAAQVTGEIDPDMPAGRRRSAQRRRRPRVRRSLPARRAHRYTDDTRVVTLRMWVASMHAVLVVHDQDGDAAQARFSLSSPAPRPRTTVLPASRNSKRHPETGAVSSSIDLPERSTMRSTTEKPEAGALAFALVVKNGSKACAAAVGRHPLAGVGDRRSRTPRRAPRCRSSGCRRKASHRAR